ncbi:LrgB family protein [Microbulbifer thermotolerans]|uniref:LrgB family protein n=1 Tax=Microbulbifer thermotolerans TaxID=252514 RepID=UPI002249A026|nr:LrgB family protein [Microbulbifer thermotolerans]MCX2830004.1 LrgB family protein [Microbulbifer thermotolerans]
MSDTLLAALSLAATLGFYYLTKTAYKHRKNILLAPLLAAPLGIIALILVLHIPLEDYYLYTHFLVMMLGPATIAFAVPIYQERRVILRYPLTLTIGVCTGLILGLFSSWLLVQIFPMPEALASGMLVRSVSMPFAMEAVTAFGGVPDITAMLVIMTGITGMALSEPIFKFAGIRTSLAKGIALGAASHGAGTAKARELGREEGVIASLTMIFTGVAMVICAPLFSQLLN